MRTCLFGLPALLMLAACHALVCATGHAQSPARYAEVMEHELAHLGRVAACEAESETRHRCSFPSHDITQGQPRQTHALYDDATDSVYIYLAQVLHLPPSAKSTPTVLRRMMELNWELLLGKFEWNAKSGEVRLSVVMSTDSNFDRRAFRSLLQTLDALSARYIAELESLQGQGKPKGASAKER